MSRKINGSRPWELEEIERTARHLGMTAEQLFPEMFPSRQPTHNDEVTSYE
jgi:hypothetical protein